MAKTEFEKLDLQTKDLTAMNIDKISAIFPNVIVEHETEQGEITKGIDFELLQQLLSKEEVEGTKEKYHLNWPGKKASLLKANTPIIETLRPDLANSKNWDKTQNIFIEGDNFKVLKILQESYLGKIKMIYIDPPYNTGKDFVYSDNFTMKKSEYAEKIGQYDEEKNKLFKENTKTNSRYHSDWLSMMYERLYIARDLLREDGVIFISIDDNEVHNLRKICDEIFGEENVETLIWNKEAEGSSGTLKQTSTTRRIHEYILYVYRNYNNIQFSKIKEPLVGRENELQTANLAVNLENEKIDNKNYFTIKNKSGDEFTRQWKWSKEEIDKLIEQDLIYWGSDGHKQPRLIIPTDERRTAFLLSILNYGGTTNGRKDFEMLMGTNVEFSYPKPIILLKKIIETSTFSNDIILDFFAGSGTTAHAVMQLNAEDGGNRKFIMVQLDEETNEKSEAYKAGYKTIAELSRERIRRAGEKILVENKDKLATRETKLDIGFRAFRVDSTNMKDVYYHPKDLKQDNLLDLVDTIKADRQNEDLLIQILLDKALTLDLPIKTQKFKENTVYIVGENDLIVCMDPVLDISIIDDLAKLGADTAVFRDSSFATEADRIKLDTHFKRLSPRDTRIIVI